MFKQKHEAKAGVAPVGTLLLFLRTAQLNVKVRQNGTGRSDIRAMCWQTRPDACNAVALSFGFFCEFAYKKSCNPIYPHDVVEYGI